MSDKKYGYVTDLPENRSLEERLSAMRASGVEERNIVTETNPKGKSRPRLTQLLQRLVAGDTLIVECINGLGHNYQEIVQNWASLERKGVGVIVLDMPHMDAGCAEDPHHREISGMVLDILTYVTENQKELRAHLQRQGIGSAREKGVRFGRPQVEIPRTFLAAVSSWRAGEITAAEAASRVNMSPRTFYRRVQQYGLNDAEQAASGNVSF